MSDFERAKSLKHKSPRPRPQHDMQAPRPKLDGEHVHRCPVCFEAAPCRETCSIEMDLTLDDGTPCGAYVKCDQCEAEPCCWGLAHHAWECKYHPRHRRTSQKEPARPSDAAPNEREAAGRNGDAVAAPAANPRGTFTEHRLGDCPGDCSFCEGDGSDGEVRASPEGARTMGGGEAQGEAASVGDRQVVGDPAREGEHAAHAVKAVDVRDGRVGDDGPAAREASSGEGSKRVLKVGQRVRVVDGGVWNGRVGKVWTLIPGGAWVAGISVETLFFRDSEVEDQWDEVATPSSVYAEQALVKDCRALVAEFRERASRRDEVQMTEAADDLQVIVDSYGHRAARGSGCADDARYDMDAATFAVTCGFAPDASVALNLKTLIRRVRSETIEACALECEAFLDRHKNTEGLKLWPVRECVVRIRALPKGSQDGTR